MSLVTRWLRPTNAPAPQTPPTTALRIVARGMCCSVGHNASTASAALDARLNHFQETAFRCDGQPLVGASLYGMELLGAARWEAMLARVCHEALCNLDAEARSRVPVVLLCNPAEAPGLGPDLAHRLMQALHAQGMGRHPDSAVVSQGKAGIATALTRARQALNSPGSDHFPGVLIAAVDSLLTGRAIDSLHAQGRIKLPSNSDGLTPGEGAAAILVGTSGTDAALCIRGLGEGEASDPWNSDEPLRGRGLIQALRAAAQSAGCAVADARFHLSGATGEARGMREIALAMGQALERRVLHLPHLPIAACLGETGCAAPVLALAWLAEAMPAPLGPGKLGLLHFGNDSGERAALVVHVPAV